MVTRDSVLPPHVLPLPMLMVINTADGRIVVSRERVHVCICVGGGTCEKRGGHMCSYMCDGGEKSACV